jgi:hypothetical protein
MLRIVRKGVGSCLLAGSVAASYGCHSAGPYGYSRSYVALAAEESAEAGAKTYDPVMVQRTPAEWKGKRVSVFGVVKTRTEGSGGAAYLTLSVRSLEARNLCDSEDEDSCRVTVSEREHAVIHAHAKLEAEDEIGQKSVGPGSLVRVIGVIGDDVDQNDGMPVLRANYYRHWPRNFFVTTADRANMRR